MGCIEMKRGGKKTYKYILDRPWVTGLPVDVSHSHAIRDLNSSEMPVTGGFFQARLPSSTRSILGDIELKMQYLAAGTC